MLARETGVDLRGQEPRRRRALLIASGYPPDNTAIGALRLASMARHLPEFGWDVTVLSVARGDVEPGVQDNGVIRTKWLDIEAPFNWLKRLIRRAITATRREHGVDAAVDQMQVQQYHARGWVFRMEQFRMRLMHFPDSRIGWYPFAVRAGKSLVRSRNIDVVISSSLPPTSHLIARRLKKVTGCGWLADYRDLWSNDPQRSVRVRPMRFLECLLERRTMRLADAVVTVSEPYAERLSDLLERPISVVENGFEENDYQGQVSPLTYFALTYTGEINDLRNCDPSPVLAAIAQLKNARMVDSDGFVLRFFGSSSHMVIPEVDRYGLQGLVQVHPRVDHAEAVIRQRESAALLVITRISEDGAGIYTGKVFEYLAAGRPILAVTGKQGAVAELLRTTGRGVAATEPEEIARVLMEWLSTFRNGSLPSFPLDDELVGRWSRRAKAKALAGILDELC